MMEADEIIALGSIVADEIYGKAMPVVVVEKKQSTITSTTGNKNGEKELRDRYIGLPNR